MSNEELKAAALAATPGPWILADDSWSDGDNANVSTEERYDGRIISIAKIEGGGSESGFDEPFSAEQQANARYITAANPAVVLALLAELEAKDKRIAELEADKRQLNEIINTEANRADAAETRLATPVGFYTTVSGRGGVVWHNGTPEDDTAIYTAPPAPAVNLTPDFETWFNSPESGFRVVNFHIQHELQLKAWSACRAAMLAQPVRRGCTVVPLGWIDCAFRVPDTDGNYWGWWSESKRQGPVWFIKSDVQAQFQSSEITHWMPLPAAPEGGNEK